MTNSDLESLELKSCIRALKEIDFELAYLALLTCEGIKPLSRWEKPLDDHGAKLLQQLGLLTRQTTRTVKIGKEVTENLFSKSAYYIELYEKRFGGTPIDKSAATLRFEGFLFGYPPCCVEQYIRHPYIKNALDHEDQKILFHWACRNCQITPLLIPAYKRIYSFLKNN